MEKKTNKLSLRTTDPQTEYVAAVAERLMLPTDGEPNRSRAVQLMIEFMRTNFGLAWLDGQGLQCPTLQAGS